MNSFACLGFLALSIFTSSPVVPAEDQETIGVWTQFVAELKKQDPKPEDLRPYLEQIRMPMVGFLSNMRRAAIWSEWTQTPEVHRVGDQLHFLTRLTLNGVSDTYVFSFIREKDRWYFQHLESIVLRLDTVTPPTSNFPDLPEDKKIWIRQENAWTKQLQLFYFLTKEKGKEFAMNWFKDGAGYALSAKTWVPMVSPERAFVLYACFEQAMLQGNKVTLERLDDHQAIIQLNPIELRLYEQTAHFRNYISKLDFMQLIESIWRDRATQAGWKLNFSCKENQCTLDMKR